MSRTIVVSVPKYFTDSHKQGVYLLISNLLGTRILERGLTGDGDDYYLIEVSRDDLVEIFRTLNNADVLILNEEE